MRRRKEKQGSPLFRVAAVLLVCGIAALSWRMGNGFQNFRQREARAAAASVMEPLRAAGDGDAITTNVSAPEAVSEPGALRKYLALLFGFDPLEPSTMLRYHVQLEPSSVPDETPIMAAYTPEEFDSEDFSPVEIEPIRGSSLAPIPVMQGQPLVLIYHTHAEEAYKKTSGQNYKEKPNSRTDNNDYNVVRLGAALTSLLNDQYGIATLHNTANYEPPKLGTAYVRSLKGMEEYAEEYPSLRVFIDIHRDAYSGSKSAQTVTIDGKKVARVMAVIGTGEGSNGQGFSVMPNWKENYKLASAVDHHLKAIDPNLSKGISVKTGRYNQHISDFSVLIEIGNNENSLEEALNAIPYVAQALSQVLPKQ